MRIPDNQTSGVGAQGVSRSQETVTVTTPRQGTEKTESGSRDQIQLSSLASHLKAESPGSAEREARIEQLRVEVSQGSYRVDVEKVSQAIIDEAIGSGGDGKKT